MAREGYKKEQELLRLLFLDGGGLSRSQLARRLGISIDGLDKTMQEVKTLIEATGSENCLVSVRQRPVYNYLRYDYYHSGQNFFYALYRNKAMKDSECIRLALLLTRLRKGPATYIELLDYLSKNNEFVDQRNLRDYLKYLAEVELIARKNRPAQYYLRQDLLEALNGEQLLELYDYVSFCVNTSLLAFPGFILQQAIYKRLMVKHYPEDLNACLYRYAYLLRVLEEQLCYQLLECIKTHNAVKVHYLRKKDDQRYYAREIRKGEHKAHPWVYELYPLRLLYDHQSGRWYLLSIDAQSRNIVSPLRVDNIVEIESLSSILEEEYFLQACQEIEHNQQYSWLVGSRTLTRVRIRFYFDSHQSKDSFLRRRVESQGRWGQIVEENNDSFIYEIDINDSTEIKPWIRSFGSSAEVLEPKGLRDELASQWQQMEASYESI